MKNEGVSIKSVMCKLIAIFTILTTVQLGLSFGPLNMPVMAGPVQEVTGIVTDYYTNEPIPNVKLCFAKNGKPDVNYGEDISNSSGYYNVQIHNGAGNICVTQAPTKYSSYCTSLDSFRTFYSINLVSRDVINPNRVVVNVKLKIEDTVAPMIDLVQSPTTPTNGRVTIATTVTDSGSGVATTKWAIGNRSASYFTSSGVILSGSMFSVSTNGTYTVYAKDRAGNASVKTIIVSNIDTRPPTINLSASQTTATNGSVSIAANVTDSESGVAVTKWDVGSKSPSYFTSDGEELSGATFSVYVNETYTVYAKDRAGNESIQSIPVNNISTIGPTAPIIRVNPEGWTKNSVSFTVSGSTVNGGTIAEYQYKIDEGQWQKYLSEVTITTEGDHTISARAVDNAGRTSATSTESAQIDKTGPSTPTIVVTPQGWTSGNVSFTVGDSRDSLSGINAYEYKIDEGQWQPYSSEVTITTEGDHIISAIAVDRAGNSSDTSTANAQIDITSPTGVITSSTASWTKSLNLTCLGDDNLSGVASIQTPGGNWVEGTTASYNVTANGIYTFNIKDNANNTTSAAITVNNIDGDSSIVKLGAYIRNNPNANYIYESDDRRLNAVRSIPITMAVLVDIESHSPQIDLNITGSYSNSNIVFRKYKLNNNLIDTSTEERVTSNSSSVRFINGMNTLESSKKVSLLPDTKYIIVFSIIPNGSAGSNVNISATVDNQTVSEDAVLDVQNLPKVQ